jgi:hypothetical protein
MNNTMTTSISDRIANVQGSLNHRSELGRSDFDDALNSPSSHGPIDSRLDTALCQLLYTHRKIGEATVVGTTRLDAWTQQSQATFLRFGEMLTLSLELPKSLTIVPWKIIGKVSDTSVLSLDAQEFRLDPTLISRLLRELPIWKKQSPLILVELGRINSDLARSLTSWCDVTVVLSHGALPSRAHHLRAIRAWRQTGHPLNAAVHVA